MWLPWIPFYPNRQIIRSCPRDQHKNSFQSISRLVWCTWWTQPGSKAPQWRGRSQNANLLYSTLGGWWTGSHVPKQNSFHASAFRDCVGQWRRLNPPVFSFLDLLCSVRSELRLEQAFGLLNFHRKRRLDGCGPSWSKQPTWIKKKQKRLFTS